MKMWLYREIEKLFKIGVVELNIYPSSIAFTVIDGELKCELSIYHRLNLVIRHWTNKNKSFLHPTIPAHTNFTLDGRRMLERYFCGTRAGQMHRIDGPALIEYDVNGNISNSEHYVEGKQIKNKKKV